MFRKSLLSVVLITSALTSVSAVASQFGQLYRNAGVTKVTIQRDFDNKSYVYVTLDKSPENNPAYTVPSCHTASDKVVIYDLSLSDGKAALSLLTTAKLTGSKINIDAYSACIFNVATVRNTELVD